MKSIGEGVVDDSVGAQSATQCAAASVRDGVVGDTLHYVTMSLYPTCALNVSCQNLPTSLDRRVRVSYTSHISHLILTILQSLTLISCTLYLGGDLRGGTSIPTTSSV